MSRVTHAAAVAAIVCLGRDLTAQSRQELEPFPPFRIADNLYYVGTRGQASYLVTSPEGHILINPDYERNVRQLEASVEQLGLRFRDVKVLLVSHAHNDHVGGAAAVKALTGARYMVMAGDVDVVESGGRSDFAYGAESHYPPAKVDRVLHDGDEVRLGGNVLVARLTPGHTKGCTTWTMKVQDRGQRYDVVIVGSPNVNPGYRLVGNELYPAIASDYERTFRVLKALPADIFLGAHGSYFDMEAKYRRMKAGDATAFVDPAGYKGFVEAKEQAFRVELTKQRQAAAP